MSNNLNTLINRLQKALKAKGKVYCINRLQFHSDKYDCICTKYTVYTTYIDADGEKQKDSHYFDKALDVVQFLADLLRDDSS